MKIIKPDTLGLLYRSFRFAQRNSLALGMMGFFHLDRSNLEALLPEAQMWAMATQTLGQGAVLDEGFPKPAGEFKVCGAACAPQGSKVREAQVGVRVGSLAKALMVTGDRHFNAAGLISAPEPYARMAITPQTAFGGVGFTDNPQGKGYAKVERDDGTSVWSLPNVENPQQRIGNRGDRSAPAGFWGFDALSPQRQKHLGACDARWLKHDWPHLPADTRAEFFQTAPADQRMSGYFAGNEALEIRQMHPQRAVIESRLPGLRARCFIHRRNADGSLTFSEIEARAETVWLFPELECGIVLYRALASVSDDSAEDVLHVMAEWESMSTQPLTFEHYHSLFLTRLPAASAQAKPIDVAPAMPAATAAIAVPAPEAIAVPAPEAVAMTPEMAAAHAMAKDLEQHNKALMNKHGLTDKDIARFLAPEPPPRALSFPEVEKMAQDLNLQSRELMLKHKLTDKDIAPFLKEAPVEPTPSMANVQSALQDLRRDTQEKMQKAGLTEADVYRKLASHPELADTAKSIQQLGPSAAADIDLAAFAALAQMAVPTFPKVDLDVPEMPAAAPESKLTREDVIARHAAKDSLAGYDLSTLDLTELDLSGADFSGALLEKALFTKSKLSAANFSQALLQGADFGGADLTQAKLTQVSAGASQFAEADLRGADLSQADFSGGDFAASRLNGATLSGAIFDGANMKAISATECLAAQASFIGCDLSGADFSQAGLQQARFNDSQLAAGNFSGAICDQAEFYGVQAQQTVFTDTSLRASRADARSQFQQAQFMRAQIVGANWTGAILHAASLEGALLDDSDFSNVQAQGAIFRHALAKGTKFAKADLSGADLNAINLFKGSLRKTKIDGTLMRDANLYGVDFEDTQPTIASIEGSNIDQTLLAFRPPVI